MKKTKLIAMTVGALAVFSTPFAAPAHAAETHVCNIFTAPLAQICGVPIGVYCSIFPTQTICR